MAKKYHYEIVSKSRARIDTNKNQSVYIKKVVDIKENGQAKVNADQVPFLHNKKFMMNLNLLLKSNHGVIIPVIFVVFLYAGMYIYGIMNQKLTIINGVCLASLFFSLFLFFIEKIKVEGFFLWLLFLMLVSLILGTVLATYYNAIMRVLNMNVFILFSEENIGNTITLISFLVLFFSRLHIIIRNFNINTSKTKNKRTM